MLAGLFVLILWWGATQALLWMVRAAETDELNAAALIIGGIGAVVALISAADPTTAGALLGFAAGLTLWAAFEIGFLTGGLLGPTTSARGRLGAADARLGKASPRAWPAFRAILWHELSLFGAFLALAAVLLPAANAMALFVFALLWAMRVSAKLNLFLGVRNDCAELLPPAVRHLERHFRHAKMNALFPVSLLAGTLGSAFLLRAALDPTASETAALSAGLLAVLCALGTLEHLLMMTPFSPLNLWSTKTPRVIPARGLGAASHNL